MQDTIAKMVEDLKLGHVEVSIVNQALSAREPGRRERRHLFAQTANKAGIPLGVIQTALGHKPSAGLQ